MFRIDQIDDPLNDRARLEVFLLQNLRRTHFSWKSTVSLSEELGAIALLATTSQFGTVQLQNGVL